MNAQPHRRRNALTGDWVLVSPQRTARPWLGRTEPAAEPARPAYDPSCYLCPGNRRANGVVNPSYDGPYVFPNDFPALRPEADPEAAASGHPLLESEPVQGECRVVCYSPRHNRTLPQMTVPDIRRVVDTWADQVADLGRRWRWVQVFENKGAVMGCSNPHPHGQIWAGDALPTEPAREDARQREHAARTGRDLLGDCLAAELERGDRIVLANDQWVFWTPFWAVWPYELLLAPRRRVERLPDLAEAERDALAAILKDMLTACDRLFDTSFPYSMGWHGAPTDGRAHPHWRLHAHVYPPLLRSAIVKKFMVGYEMLGEPQRDLTPEQAAERLRGQLTNGKDMGRLPRGEAE